VLNNAETLVLSCKVLQNSPKLCSQRLRYRHWSRQAMASKSEKIGSSQRHVDLLHIDASFQYSLSICLFFDRAAVIFCLLIEKYLFWKFLIWTAFLRLIRSVYSRLLLFAICL
jgi:hypothetical protein